MTFVDNLQGMRVMVTRPKPLGDALCKRIEAAGGVAVYFPVMEIVPVKPTVNVETFDWIIFVSPQAVLQTSLSIPSQVKIAAIGAGTAQLLQEKNIVVTAYPKEDWRSEGLLGLPEFQHVQNQKIAIFSGENGRPFLMDELQRRGAIVTKVVLYQRILPTLSDKPCDVDVIVCTSNEGVTYLLELLNKKILSKPLLVISQRILTHARELGFKKIFLAKNASHHAILTALVQAKGDIMESPRRFFSWANIGILISALSVVVLIFVFYFAYYSLFFLNKNTTAHLAAIKETLQHLQRNVADTQQWGDEIKNQAQMIATLQQAEKNNQRNEVIVEARFLVKRANDSLQWDKNVAMAITLLQNADQTLRELTNPDVTTLRQAIATDIATLQAIPSVDEVGIYSRLSALSEQVTQLPLPVHTSTPVSKDALNSEAPWWKRGLQETWQALRHIVIVRYNPSGTPPLMTPEQQDFLYENMQAVLEKTMWALLHKQPVIYQKSLQQAITWIKKYFVQDVQVTQSMLANLNELQQININPSLPTTLTAMDAFQHSVSGT